MLRGSYNGLQRGMSRRIGVRRSCLSFPIRSGSTVFLEPDSLIEEVGILSISRDQTLEHTLLCHSTAESVEDGKFVRSAWIVDAEGLDYQLDSGLSGRLSLHYMLFHSPLYIPHRKHHSRLPSAPTSL